MTKATGPTVNDILVLKDIILRLKARKAAIYNLLDRTSIPRVRQVELRKLDDRIHGLTRSLTDTVLACDELRMKR